MKEAGMKHQEASFGTDNAVQVREDAMWGKSSLGEGSSHWKQ